MKRPSNRRRKQGRRCSRWPGYGNNVQEIAVGFPAGPTDLFLLQSARTRSGVHPTSYWNGNGENSSWSLSDLGVKLIIQL